MKLKEGYILRDGTYKILGILGQGGFGITYLALHIALNKEVAIKEFFPRDYCTRDPENDEVVPSTEANSTMVKRLKDKFRKEALHMARVESANIVGISDVFEQNGTVYYIMDYIPGKTISTIIEEQGRIPIPQAVFYIKGVGAALKALHAKRMNHFDIKPANIIIREKDNMPILVDFGLSKQYDASGQQTSTTTLGVSPGYAPPEQYSADGIKAFSPETDIYALTATYFKMITGQTPPESLNIYQAGFPRPNNIDDFDWNIVSKGMAMQKEQRYHSVDEMINELDNAPASHKVMEVNLDPEPEKPVEKDTDSVEVLGVVEVLDYIPADQQNNPESSQNEPVKDKKKSSEEARQQRMRAQELLKQRQKEAQLRKQKELELQKQREEQKRKQEEQRRQQDEQRRLFEEQQRKQKEAEQQRQPPVTPPPTPQGPAIFEEQPSGGGNPWKTLMIALGALIIVAGAVILVFALRKPKATMIDGHEYVDMGLPSGNKWATCNVGASSPYESGYYFTWGDISPKDVYSNKNSIVYKKNRNEMRSKGIIDNSDQLTLRHDAAQSTWGVNWFTPSDEDFQELIYQCEWTPTTQHNVEGYKVTGPNGKSIFIPLAGWIAVEAPAREVGQTGQYLSSTAPTDGEDFGTLNLKDDLKVTHWRESGFPIRPVNK